MNTFITSRSTFGDAEKLRPLPLPNGLDARDLRLPALRQALAPILPGFDPTAGKNDLLVAYERHLAEKPEAPA